MMVLWHRGPISFSVSGPFSLSRALPAVDGLSGFSSLFATLFRIVFYPRFPHIFWSRTISKWIFNPFLPSTSSCPTLFSFMLMLVMSGSTRNCSCHCGHSHHQGPHHCSIRHSTHTSTSLPPLPMPPHRRMRFCRATIRTHSLTSPSEMMRAGGNRCERIDSLRDEFRIWIS